MIVNTGDLLLQAKHIIEQHIWYVDRYGDSRKDKPYIDEAEVVLDKINAWEAGRNDDKE